MERREERKGGEKRGRDRVRRDGESRMSGETVRGEIE